MNKVIEKSISQIAYEKYQLDWIKSHVDSIDDLFEICNEAMREKSSAKDYLEEHGINREIYSCYEEFLVSEYKDLSYMSQLLDKKEFVEYLKDNSYTTYNHYIMTEVATIELTGYGFMEEYSDTDNPEETCRIVDCDFAELELDSLTGDLEKDDDIIQYAFQNAEHEVFDVTVEKLYERIYELLSEGAKVVEYNEIFDIFAKQKFICFSKK